MKRINKIDILKGIAIICMVLGHAIQLYNGADYRNEKMFYSNVAYKIIYTFHMPLFMVVSGYLFFISLQKDNSFKMIKRKVITYSIPIIVFAILKTLPHAYIQGFSLLLIKDVAYNVLHTLWFLWALIYACVSVWVFEKIKNQNLKCILCMIAIVLVFITPDILMSNVFKYTIPYFFVGYCYGKKQLNFNKRIYWLSVPTWVLMLFFYGKEHYIYVSGINLNIFRSSNFEIMEKLYIDLYRYIIGLVGCLAVYKIVNVLCKAEENFIVKGIAALGKNTLGMYILTTEIMNELIYKCLENNSYGLFRTIVISTMVIIISFFLTELINRTKYLKLLILGKR